MSVRRAVVALWNRACVVPLLLFRAERDLRRGHDDASRRRFRDAVRRSPTCFRAHFGLARACAAAGDVDAARRELAIARHLAPSRFRELSRRLPDELLLVPPAPLPARATVPQPAPPVRDDFVSAAERARFRALGPIRDDEREAADWDRLAAELGHRDG